MSKQKKVKQFKTTLSDYLRDKFVKYQQTIGESEASTLRELIRAGLEQKSKK